MRHARLALCLTLASCTSGTPRTAAPSSPIAAPADRSTGGHPHLCHVFAELTDEKHGWYVTPCGTTDVYKVQAYTSDEAFFLAKRLQSLREADPAARILVELHGEVLTSGPFPGADRRLDGMLLVPTLVAIEHGSCDALPGHSQPD